MKKLLSISLVFLLLVLINSQVDYEEDESNLLVNKETIKKYEKSLKKLKRIMRLLEAMSDLSDDNSSEDDQPSDQSIESSEPPETTEPINPGNQTESDDPLAEPTIPSDIVYPDPPSVHPTYYRPRINRNALIHILRYKLFRVEEKTNRAKPFLIRFVLLVRFINMSPLAHIQFTLKVIISLSNIQENYKDAPVVCYKSSEIPYEKSVIDTYYICSAEVDSNPLHISSYNDFNFRNNEGNILELGASLQAIKAAKSLNEEIQPMREVVSFDNAILEKGTNSSYNSLIIKGNLRGNKREEVAQQEKLIFTFFEDKGGDTINALNSTCDVKKHDPDDFEIECYPENININGTQQFLTNGTTVVLNSESKNNIEIYLNNTQKSDSFSFYGEPKLGELNRKAHVHFLGYNNYRTRRHPRPLNLLRPILIQFTLFIHYVRYSHIFGKVTFTVQLIYRTYRLSLRGLQEEETRINTTAVCENNPEYYAALTNTSLYDCTAEAPEAPDHIQGFMNFEYFDENGKPVVPEDEHINLAREIIEDVKNLTTRVSTFTDIVFFSDAYFYLNEKDPNSFFVKGTLEGDKKSTVAQEDSFIMTFYDTISKEVKNGYNTTCEVVNKNSDDFLVKCSPVHNITGDQFLANGTTNDNEVGIYLNNTENSSSFEFRIYDRNDANVKWRKNSSGLSGGAIAGIVIACAVALILITILAMFFRRSKITHSNNSTIIGLKSIDNYNE